MKVLRVVFWLGVMSVVGVLVLIYQLGGARQLTTLDAAETAAQLTSTGDESRSVTSGAHTLDKTALELSEDDVEHLRSAGWNCPNLEVAGYWLESARLEDRAGQLAVVSVLRNQYEAVTVVEQHPPRGTDRPVDAVTATSVTPQKYTETTDSGTTYWQAKDASDYGYTVVFRIDDAVFTVLSEHDKDNAARVARVVATTEHARVQPTARDDDPGLLQRMDRGMDRLLRGDW